jgi:hypothetical protein
MSKSFVSAKDKRKKKGNKRTIQICFARLDRWNSLVNNEKCHTNPSVSSRLLYSHNHNKRFCSISKCFQEKKREKNEKYDTEKGKKGARMKSFDKSTGVCYTFESDPCAALERRRGISRIYRV